MLALLTATATLLVGGMSFGSCPGIVGAYTHAMMHHIEVPIAPQVATEAMVTKMQPVLGSKRMQIIEAQTVVGAYTSYVANSKHLKVADGPISVAEAKEPILADSALPAKQTQQMLEAHTVVGAYANYVASNHHLEVPS
eukprot:CAMPEP_0115858016 /NCGR_PEP_ID=MMETSP0287-20121206/15877_1 /TAXON_ID=412157 /ORGANISM="Chrysochromulina rotalis, Strain UIO044" /LENGTH=138 /DNA_ID=CAMNT_0003312261 /DNA_START=24 /DNA_END=440 /DNA_ORIENTATION=+